MRCPYCGASDTKVLETREASEAAAVRRRRRCGACDAALYTMERVDTTPLVVLTPEGGREDFDRVRLVESLAVAGEASLSTQRREEIAEVVIARLRDKGPVVSSHEIGDLVLDVLSLQDVATFIRYAIAFECPADISEFATWIRNHLGASSPTVDLLVIKADGQHEVFDPGRVRESLRHAAKGRKGVTEASLNELVDQVATRVSEKADRSHPSQPATVSSRLVADVILECLLAFDPVAYLHYAVTVKNLATYPRLLGELDYLSRPTHAPRTEAGAQHD